MLISALAVSKFDIVALQEVFLMLKFPPWSPEIAPWLCLDLRIKLGTFGSTEETNQFFFTDLE